MNYTIENEALCLTVSTHGGERYDLRRKAAPDAPLVWDGDPLFWSYRAPILSPWCSKMEEGWYTLDGKRYENKRQHGFPRTSNFVFKAQTRDSITLQFDFPGDETFWPWPFSFEVRHKLKGTVVETICTAGNLSGRPMPAQLGFHTALRWPFTPGKAMEDYFLRFEQPEAPGGGNILPLYRFLFEKDRPWPAPGLKSKWIQLEEKETGNYLRIDTEGFPFVLLWSAKGAPDFLCIEPWTGNGGPGHDLDKRPGTILIPPGERFTCIQRLTVGQMGDKRS